MPMAYQWNKLNWTSSTIIIGYWNVSERYLSYFCSFVTTTGVLLFYGKKERIYVFYCYFIVKKKDILCLQGYFYKLPLVQQDKYLYYNKTDVIYHYYYYFMVKKKEYMFFIVILL